MNVPWTNQVKQNKKIMVPLYLRKIEKTNGYVDNIGNWTINTFEQKVSPGLHYYKLKEDMSDRTYTSIFWTVSKKKKKRRERKLPR